MNQDDWRKFDKTLYPDKTDRTQTVKDAQASFVTNLNTYIKEALENGFYTASKKGTGLVLTARTSFTYVAVCFEDGSLCEIYTRQNNKQHVIKIYPNTDDENAAATRARSSMVTQLAIIDLAAKKDSFFK